MTRARARKYHLGRSQKSRYRQRADRLLLECGVTDYLATLAPEAEEPAGPAVMTVRANPRHRADYDGNMAQMLLWDQPVYVPVSTASDTTATPPPVAAGSPETRPQVAGPRTPEPAPTATGRQHGAQDQVTLVGFLKGCGIGLATAAALLLIYVLIN